MRSYLQYGQRAQHWFVFTHLFAQRSPSLICTRVRNIDHRLFPIHLSTAIAGSVTGALFGAQRGALKGCAAGAAIGFAISYAAAAAANAAQSTSAAASDSGNKR
jgi:hypothetical protein